MVSNGIGRVIQKKSEMHEFRIQCKWVYGIIFAVLCCGTQANGAKICCIFWIVRFNNSCSFE